MLAFGVFLESFLFLRVSYWADGKGSLACNHYQGRHSNTCFALTMIDLNCRMRLEGGVKMSEEHRLITARELAERLELPVEVIWRYTRESKIPYVQLGKRQYRYILDDVISHLGDKDSKSNEMVREEAVHSYRPDRIYTYSDYLQLPDEENYYYEILDGTLIKESAPTKAHQRTSRNLQRILEDYFWDRDPEAEIFNAPIDLTLSDTNVIQPDLVYAPDDSDSLDKRRINVIPELIVEVISPSTQRKDRIRKLGIYSRLGVPHYWIVDPQGRTLEAFMLSDSGEYVLSSSAEGGEVFTHPYYPGLTIEIEVLWTKGRL